MVFFIQMWRHLTETWGIIWEEISDNVKLELFRTYFTNLYCDIFGMMPLIKSCINYVYVCSYNNIALENCFHCLVVVVPATCMCLYHVAFCSSLKSCVNLPEFYYKTFILGKWSDQDSSWHISDTWVQVGITFMLCYIIYLICNCMYAFNSILLTWNTVNSLMFAGINVRVFEIKVCLRGLICAMSSYLVNYLGTHCDVL